MGLHLRVIVSQKQWEDFVLLYSPQSLFQSWAWGEVEKKSGKIVSRYGIVKDDELFGVMQVLTVRAKRGTFLHIRQGPIMKNYSQEVFDNVFRALMPLAKAARAWFIRISPMTEDTGELRMSLTAAGCIRSPIHEVDAERCWVLDIQKNEDILLQSMRKTTRYEIRRGLKMDITIKQSKNIKDLDLFSDMYQETSKRHGFVSHGSVYEEFEQFVSTGNVLLYLGYYEKQLIAGALILFYGDQAIYHHGASIPSKAPVSYVLQWYSIVEAKKRNLKLYNFYGIAPEDKPHHPWKGLTMFKKGFGGQEVRYMHSHDYPISPFYIIPATIESVRTRLRGY